MAKDFSYSVFFLFESLYPAFPGIFCFSAFDIFFSPIGVLLMLIYLNEKMYIRIH